MAPAQNNPFITASSSAQAQAQDELYVPPLGPPPGRREHHSAVPQGLPPSGQTLEHRAPLGRLAETESCNPPPGPPPSASNDDPAPPYHDWQSVPDTALLPPPPSLGYEFSFTSNAEEEDAERARAWCEQHPLMRPLQPAPTHVRTVQSEDIALQKPPGRPCSIRALSIGHWNVSTTTDSLDTCLISSLPLFFATNDSPLQTGKSKTIYYEVKIKSLQRRTNGEASAAAVGFCAVPYPPFRMPGWERGSLAVHTDDGRRYVNDNLGGKDFTTPITAGETIGIGFSFALQAISPYQSGNALRGEVFLTRDGQKAGSWDLHEELDQENELGILGIDGRYDLFAAVGLFGRVSLDVVFNSREWLWKP